MIPTIVESARVANRASRRSQLEVIGKMPSWQPQEETSIYSIREMLGVTAVTLNSDDWTFYYFLTDAAVNTASWDGRFLELTCDALDKRRCRLVLLDRNKRVVAEIEGRSRYHLARRRVTD